MHRPVAIRRSAAGLDARLRVFETVKSGPPEEPGALPAGPSFLRVRRCHSRRAGPIDAGLYVLAELHLGRSHHVNIRFAIQAKRFGATHDASVLREIITGRYARPRSRRSRPPCARIMCKLPEGDSPSTLSKSSRTKWGFAEARNMICSGRKTGRRTSVSFDREELGTNR